MEELEGSVEAIETHHPPASISQFALSSAIFAVLAAVTAMLSNYHANEAVIDLIHASDQWSYYQAKGIKTNLLTQKVDLLTAMGKLANQADLDKIGEYKTEQDQISEIAREKERSSTSHLRHHVVLARAVTLFQVAIAISAIAILTRRVRFWKISLLAATIGLFLLMQGIFLSF